jgi:hypothetical protein
VYYLGKSVYIQYDFLLIKPIYISPGVHFLQDPRTKVYNFDQFIQTIPTQKQFNYDALPPFVKPSKDEASQY